MHQLLIVDDQIDLADDLAHMLPWETVGISKVFKAYSAQEALAIMRTEPIDVVITDIKMPGMSGLEFIERVRAAWRNVKLILLSGYSDFEYARTALANQVSDYLLKPASDEELLAAVQKAVGELEDWWREVSSTRKALQSLEENLPILRRSLLVELLGGRKFKADELANKLGVLRLPLSPDNPVCMMLIRLEDYFDQYDRNDISLIEYAVTNMAEEIFGDEFHLWYAKEEHDYWVFLIQTKPDDTADPLADSMVAAAAGPAAGEAAATAQDALLEKIERKTSMLQYYVRLYLKGTISAMISDLVRFPEEVATTYDTLIIQFLQRIGNDRELIILSPGHVHDRGAARHLSQLYEPPLLMHLLEAGRWEALREKLSVAFAELEEHWGDSHEHILEVYYAIASSISYAVHKKKQWLAELLPDEYNRFTVGVHFHTIAQLRDWTWRILDILEQAAATDQQDNRKEVIRQVQQYVTDHLKHANLQEIAAHVYLNPSYLSKIYKLETGEGISEFIYRLRMEQAAHLLRTTNLKVYEVAEQLGYQKTSYFIKLFKDKYQCTPQEYKDMVSRD